MELQAQDGKLEAIARHDVQVISTEGGIEVVSPNLVSIKVGGTELKITPEGVFITTPGIFRVKAGEHVFEGGDKVIANLPHFPTSGIYSRRFDFSELFDNEELIKGIRYKLINHSKNTSCFGILDEYGRTPRVFGNEADDIEAIIIGHDTSDELIVYENTVEDSGLDSHAEDCGCCADENADNLSDDTENDADLTDDLEGDFHAFGN